MEFLMSMTPEAAILTNSFNLRRERLHEQISQIIENMIIEKQFQPGGRLPSERDLVTLFKVNRTTLRQALRTLEQKGLIEMKSGSGAYVKTISKTVIVDAINRYVTFKRCSKDEVMACREMIEPEIAAMAAQFANSEDIEKLENIIQQMETAVENDDMENYATYDLNFHEALAAASHNNLVIAIISGIHKIVRDWISVQTQALWPVVGRKRLQESVFIHRNIYEAVRDGRIESVREHMNLHWKISRKLIEEEAMPD